MPINKLYSCLFYFSYKYFIYLLHINIRLVVFLNNKLRNSKFEKGISCGTTNNIKKKPQEQYYPNNQTCYN